MGVIRKAVSFFFAVVAKILRAALPNYPSLSAFASYISA